MSLLSFLMVAITSVIILFVHLYLIFMECSKIFVPQLYIDAEKYKEDSRTTAMVLLLISIIGYSILLFGSGIKGNRIDVYVGNNHNACMQGRFNVVTEVRAYVP